MLRIKLLQSSFAGTLWVTTALGRFIVVEARSRRPLRRTKLHIFLEVLMIKRDVFLDMLMVEHYLLGKDLHSDVPSPEVALLRPPEFKAPVPFIAVSTSLEEQTLSRTQRAFSSHFGLSPAAAGFRRVREGARGLSKLQLSGSNDGLVLGMMPALPEPFSLCLASSRVSEKKLSSLDSGKCRLAGSETVGFALPLKLRLLSRLLCFCLGTFLLGASVDACGAIQVVQIKRFEPECAGVPRHRFQGEFYD